MANKTAPRWPVYLVLVLLVLVTIVFVVMFTAASVQDDASSADSSPSENYAERAAALLDGADPTRGEQLISQFDCAACHVLAAGASIAPPFEGVAVRAAERRPGLSAEEYIYESIVHPTAYVVEDYAGSMPQNYAQRLTDAQLGDIMAYLLTLD